MSLDGYERLHAVEKQVNIKPHNSITDQSWDGGRISVASFTVSVITECMFIILTGEINWLRTSTIHFICQEGSLYIWPSKPDALRKPTG